MTPFSLLTFGLWSFFLKDYVSDPARTPEGLGLLFEYLSHKADILESEDSMSMCLKLNGDKLHQDWQKIATVCKELKSAMAEGAGLVDFPLPVDFVSDALAFAQR